VLQARERAPIPPFVVFFFGLAVKFIIELEGASYAITLEKKKKKVQPRFASWVMEKISITI